MDFMPDSLALRFLIAFLVVLALIGIAAWVVRRFGSGRLGASGPRGRQPRLAVIDYASVDARRRLILVRRDNVEHLLMTGGPTDVVVESNIVRAVAAPREPALPRDMTMPRQPEPLPRAIPHQDNGGAWPLAPEPATAASPPPLPSMPPAPPLPSTPPRATPRAEAATEESTQWPLQPHAEGPAARPQRDTLAALADELSARPAPRPRAGGTTRVPAIEPRPQAPPRIPAPPAAATPAAAAGSSLAPARRGCRIARCPPRRRAAATAACGASGRSGNRIGAGGRIAGSAPPVADPITVRRSKAGYPLR
jgi:hypothetical protein